MKMDFMVWLACLKTVTLPLAACGGGLSWRTVLSERTVVLYWLLW